MEPYILTIGTVRVTVRARKLLADARIPARLIKTVQKEAGGGCVYGLEISPADLPAATRHLTQNRIPYTWVGWDR